MLFGVCAVVWLCLCAVVPFVCLVSCCWYLCFLSFDFSLLLLQSSQTTSTTFTQQSNQQQHDQQRHTNKDMEWNSTSTYTRRQIPNESTQHITGTQHCTSAHTLTNNDDERKAGVLIRFVLCSCKLNQVTINNSETGAGKEH